MQPNKASRPKLILGSSKSEAARPKLILYLYLVHNEIKKLQSIDNAILMFQINLNFNITTPIFTNTQKKFNLGRADLFVDDRRRSRI